MLVDTDIIIDYLKDVHEAIEFVETHIDQIAISSITVAELYQGVKDGAEKDVLDVFLSAISVLHTDLSIGRNAGLFRRQYKPSHNPGLADCLIAATSIEHGIPLKTLNTKHFPMVKDVSAPYSKSGSR